MNVQPGGEVFPQINPVEFGLPANFTIEYLTMRWDRTVQQIRRECVRGMDKLDLDFDGTTMEYENLMSVRGMLHQVMQQITTELANAVARRIANADRIYEQATRPMSMSLFFPGTRAAFGLPPDEMVGWERRLPTVLHGDMRVMYGGHEAHVSLAD